LSSEAVGEVETRNNVLIVRRIHVTYHLKVPPGKREAALRAHDAHVKRCPVAQTIGDCVEITTSMEMQDTKD
jgi:uncharacterized OsmC-like protein